MARRSASLLHLGHNQYVNVANDETLIWILPPWIFVWEILTWKILT